MSAQISVQRKEYYDILEKAQKGDLDITSWLSWFLNCLMNALITADVSLETVLKKHKFWSENTLKISNERQRLMLNKLFEGFEGKLTSTKWAKIAKCSQDTALRDIQDLISKGILKRSDSGGRSTSYDLKK